MKNFLDVAIQEAITNPIKRPLPKLACVLTNYHDVYVGLNSRKTHPLQARYSSNPQAILMHAEIDAIRQAVRKERGGDLSDFDMYVARVHRNGCTALAKPCRGCLRAIVAFGIKNVFWTE